MPTAVAARREEYAVLGHQLFGGLRQRRRGTGAGQIPELTAYQVINRIVQSAHNPPAGVDNKLGYGLVDPVAALTFNIPSGDRMAPGAQSRVITPAAPPPPPDHRARNIAIGFVGAVATGVLAMAIGARLRRAR